MAKIIPFRRPTPIVQGGYQFKEKPVAKSSTAVLTSTPGAIACAKCGCRVFSEPGKVTWSQAGPGGCRTPGCSCHQNDGKVWEA